MDRIILADQTHWASDNSSESLAAAILEMSAIDLEAIGSKASKQVAARYSWRKVFSQMFDVYQELGA
jgi:glycosyltransferase involved in cell wall biosynthesis